MTTLVLDQARAEEFAGRLFELYTGGLLTSLIDIGFRTGLFEAAAQGPTTSAGLAERAGLNERYVREWLGALTTGGIIEYDGSARTYTLPPEHAASLTGAGAANLAPSSQIMVLLAEQVDGVTRAFREGGGVPYERFRPRFTDVMDTLGRGTYDELLIAEFLPLAGDLTAHLERGIRAADVGCGTGHCVNLMAQAYPASAFVGYDLSAEAIARARAEAAELGLANATFEVLDVAALPATPGFDAVFAFDAIHDQAAPATVLRRVYEALTPGGVFFMVDINASSDLQSNMDNPLAPMLYAISTLHCMTVSLAAGGAGLGTVWGRELAERMLAEAGFLDTTVHDAPGDPLDLVYVTYKPDEPR
ncbi:class I SAM-dependent methyltransferase [Micromonospora sp. CPCC 205371]|nr:class I SAM-dependent methyltransferase [Micromonospora sp. CPCC 205371]